MTDVMPEGSFAAPHGLSPAQQDVLDRLGAPVHERPRFDPMLRHEVRELLEHGLAPLREHIAEGERLFISKHRIEKVHGCEVKSLADDAVPFEWSPAAARGSVAHKAVELTVTARGNRPPLDVVDDAIATLQQDGRGVGDWLARATEAEVADVRAQANAHLTAFLDCWPPLERRWRPVTEMSLRVELLDGLVVASGRPDLTLGTAQGDIAGKVIVDFKTGAFHLAHRHDLHFYALLELLRVGTPPRLLVSSYLEQGRIECEEVTDGLFESTVRRVVAGATRIVELQQGDEPVRRPGTPCRWCPVLDDCDVGRRFLDDADDLTP